MITKDVASFRGVAVPALRTWRLAVSDSLTLVASRHCLLALAVGSLIAVGACSAEGAVIDDVGFFDSISHTLINFESNGSGDPVDVAEGSRKTLPAAEYAAQGFSFDQNLYWRNYRDSSFDAAQAIGGSPDTAVFTPVLNQEFIPNEYLIPVEFRIDFSIPVHAFGFWVVSNNEVASPGFTALDSAGRIIETVYLGGSLVDGAVGVAEYGFMGIHSPTTTIASVQIEKLYASLDDFRFTGVPEPQSATFFIVGSVVVALAGYRECRVCSTSP